MKFTKVFQHPHELLPKKQKNDAEKKRVHATVRLFFHILPLSEKISIQQKQKKNKAGAPRCAAEE